MLKRILKISALFVSIILIALILAMLTACEPKQDNPDVESTVSHEEVIGQVEDDEKEDNVTETIVDNPSDIGTTIPNSSFFEIHFIDVGQADAALIICDGHSMLIDGGNKSDSSLIYSYLKKLNVTELDYIVCTHPHEDHVGGLAGALNYAIAKTALCPVTNYDSDGFRNFVKYLGNQNVEITVPNAGDVYGLGCAEVMILGPIIKSSGNDNSIVLRIEYGQTSFLFTGDAEREEEQDILNAGYSLCSTVLKVGHHGSDSSTCYEFLYNIMPQYAVISVGEDNAYGHPSEDVLSRLRDADVSVYRTDLQGDIICVSDGLSVDFTVERNANIDTLAAVGANSIQRGMPSEDERSTDTTVSYDYVLNTNTKKFHYPSCASVNQMKDKNKQFFSGTRDELIANGYSPCGNCNP